MSLKVKYNASTTGKNSKTMNVSASDPFLSETGAGTYDGTNSVSEVTLESMSKYNIEVGQDMKTFRNAEVPFISILSNLGGKSLTSHIDSWSDDYEGEAWVDLRIDDLRESPKADTYDEEGETWVDENIGAGEGGKLAFSNVDAYPSPGNNMALSEANYAKFESGNEFNFGYGISDDDIVGKKEKVIRKIANTLAALKYTHTDFNGDSGSDVYHKYSHESGASTMLYMAWDDLHYYDDSGSEHYQDHEIIVGITEFIFKSDFSEFVLKLDFDESNLDFAFESEDRLYWQEFDETNGAYSRISRLGLIANFDNAPKGIPEGSDFSRGTNFNYGFSQYANFTQIFASDAYGVTGTRLAEKVRFHDDVAKSRKRHMMLYKQGINASAIYGKKSERFDSETGYPVREMSGILDYGMFPIRYMKEGFPAFASSIAEDGYNYGVGAAVFGWFDSIAEALNAFKIGEGQGHTLLCSKKIMGKLNAWMRFIATSNQNVAGFTIQKNAPAPVNMYIPNITVDTNNGKLTFVEDKALNYMPKMSLSDVNGAGLPLHLISTAPSPRDMIIALDKSNIELTTLRSDKIEGSIQKPGEDLFEEAIRGEHSFRLRYPRNHAIIDAS